MFSRFADELLLRTSRSTYAKQCKKAAKKEMTEAKKYKPCYDTEAIKSLYSTKEDLAYIKRRRDEFLKSLAAILNERLQPGFAKVGKGLAVGQCPFPILDHWFGFCTDRTIRKRKVLSVTIDGVKKPRRRFYYQWKKGILPDLNVDYDYFHRDHGTLSGQSKD
jgi:hypothetical protein